jgi:hypothetical protein
MALSAVGTAKRPWVAARTLWYALAAVVGTALLITGVVAASGDGLTSPARADTWETTPPTTPFAGSATPATGDKAQTVINQLQSSGFKVILNRIGSAPLDQCTVSSTTPGQQIISPVTAGAGSLSWVVQFTTIYLTADRTKPAAKPST